VIEKSISSKTLYQGKFLCFKEDHVEIQVEPPIRSLRQYLVHPGGVCVVPILDDKKIVLIKQYRMPVSDLLLEIPAGKIDPGETDNLETAKRELKEETGFTARTWIDLGYTLPCPGYSTEKLYIYLAKNLEPGVQNLDHGEVIENYIITIDEAIQKIRTGEIIDSKTIVGIHLALNYL
jgi:ADP-ribose pyrophosphatase